jgi:hypothetical protein
MPTLIESSKGEFLSYWTDSRTRSISFCLRKADTTQVIRFKISCYYGSGSTRDEGGWSILNRILSSGFSLAQEVNIRQDISNFGLSVGWEL